MRNNMSEVMDLALTQAIECYMEMEPDAVYDAITHEWHEQMAVLLVEFFFKTNCRNCSGMPEFIELPREHGDTGYFLPVCSCASAET